MRTFVAIAQEGSISAAADIIHLTQSALSLQMKKLEEHAGVALLDRHHRGVVLTAGGRALLPYAQSLIHLHDQAAGLLTGRECNLPVRIGMIQDLTDGFLSDVLVRFLQIQPHAKLQIRTGNSTELRALLGGGVIDIAIALGEADHSECVVTLPVLWFGHEYLLQEDGALSLVVMEGPCCFRDMAIEALESSGRPYTIAMEVPNVGVLCAAVNAGIGVTCSSEAIVRNRLPLLHGMESKLDQISVTLSTPPSPSPYSCQLTRLLRDAILSLDHTAGVK